MPAHDKNIRNRCLPFLGLVSGLVLGQAVFADSEQPARAEAASAPTAMSGPQVYNNVCIACHSPPGIGGAPALGDSAAWASRLERGVDELVHHALNGYSGSTGIMPKKGGRLDLSDAEIIAAVEFMVERVTP